MDDALPVTLYSYTAQNGATVVVSSLDDVPLGARATMRTHDPSAPPPAPGAPVAAVPAWVGPVHVASLAAGALLALAAVVAWKLARRRPFLVAGLAGAAGLALLGGAYLAFALRATGASAGALASPQEVVDHAQRTADQAAAAERRKASALEAATRE